MNRRVIAEVRQVLDLLVVLRYMVCSREGLMMASGVLRLLTVGLLQLQKSSLTLEMTRDGAEMIGQLARASGVRETKKVRSDAKKAERTMRESV